MTNPIDRAAANHALLRERLKAQFDLLDGDEALADTLEGISDFSELIIAAAREASIREAQAEAMKAVIDANKARKERHEKAAQSIRDAIAHAMTEAGEKSIKAPDISVSIRPGGKHVEIVGEIEREWCSVKEVVTPDKSKIKAALEDGQFIGGAFLKNGAPILTIRDR